MRVLIVPLLALSMLIAAVPSGRAADTERPYFETVKTAPGFLPRSTPEAVGLDAQRLQAFVESARLANSDALIVLKDGKVVVERYFDQSKGSIACMAITQAVASLAIGKLLDEGRIRSLDEPLITWFSEGRPDPSKAPTTLRQVLTRTEPEDGNAMLLAGIVKAASGQPIDDYLQDKIFLPMGIVDWKWSRDQAGNPDTVGGLSLRPRDLAKIGQLMLDQGRWRGRQLLSIGYVTEATAPARRLDPHHALGWHLHYPDGYNMRRYFSHDGRLGQYLAVDPTNRLVAVRMIRDQRPDQDNPRETFGSFYDQFERLTGR